MTETTHPGITVVIPAYNAAKRITGALDSVLAQTRPAEACVVVDDGSTDETADAVRAWADAHVELQVTLVQQENGGAAAARSAGVTAAETDLVALLDADDHFLPHALETLDAAFEIWSDLIVSFADAERILAGHGEGNPYLADKPILDLPFDLPEETAGHIRPSDGQFRRVRNGLFESLLRGSYIANGAALVSRQAALDVGLWNPAYTTAEDRDFWLRLTRLGPFAYTRVPVARIFYHDENLSAGRGAADHLTDAGHVLKGLIDDAEALRLEPAERSAAERALEETVDAALLEAARSGPATFRRVARALGRPLAWIRPALGMRLIRSLFR